MPLSLTHFQVLTPRMTKVNPRSSKTQYMMEAISND